MPTGKRPCPQPGLHKRRRTGADASDWCNILEIEDPEAHSSTQESSWDGLAPSDPSSVRPLHKNGHEGGDERIKIVHSALPDRTLVVSHRASGEVADTHVEAPSEGEFAAAREESPPPRPAATPSSRILQFFKKKPSTVTTPTSKISAPPVTLPSTPLSAAPKTKKTPIVRMTRSTKAVGKPVKGKKKKSARPNSLPPGCVGKGAGRMTRSKRAVARPGVNAQPTHSMSLEGIDNDNHDGDAFKELSLRLPAPTTIDIPSDGSDDEGSRSKKVVAGKVLDCDEEDLLCSQGSVTDLVEQAVPSKKGRDGGPKVKRTALNLPKRAPSTPKDNACRVGLEIIGKDRFAAAELRQKRGSSKRSKDKEEKLRKDRKQLKTIFTAVPNCSYEVEQKRWTFPLCYYKELLKCLRSFGVTIEAVPKTVMSVMLEQNEAAASLAATVAAAGGEQIDLSRIPPDMLHALYPFQLRGVVYALKKSGRCIIGDEMGLGKTLQAIAIAACYRDEWPLLIICPSSLRVGWSEELTRWLKLCPLDINVIMNGKGNVSSPVNIISYELVPRLAAEIEIASFRVIIADESHYLKNLKAKRTKAIEPLLENAKRVLLLSGTPALSRPAELYPQIKAVKPDLFPKFEPFGVRYCAGHKGQFGWDYTGASHLEELHCILSHTVMIRRRKEDVLHELPEKQRHTVQIDAMVDVEQREKLIELRRLERQGTGYQYSNPAKEAMRHKQELTTMLYSESAVTKLDGVLDYVKTTLAHSDEKLILFAHHQAMMNGIEELLHDLKVQHIRIDGSTPAGGRHALVAQFQKREHCRVALLSITAGGTGLTLHSASIVIFCELYWTPAMLLQAEDRAHRIGQEKNVSIYYLLAKGTIDDIIWPMVSKKLDILGKAIDGENDQEMGAVPVLPYMMPELEFEERLPRAPNSGSSLDWSGADDEPGGTFEHLGSWSPARDEEDDFEMNDVEGDFLATAHSSGSTSESLNRFDVAEREMLAASDPSLVWSLTSRNPLATPTSTTPHRKALAAQRSTFSGRLTPLKQQKRPLVVSEEPVIDLCDSSGDADSGSDISEELASVAGPLPKPSLPKPSAHVPPVSNQRFRNGILQYYTSPKKHKSTSRLPIPRVPPASRPPPDAVEEILLFASDDEA